MMILYCLSEESKPSGIKTREGKVLFLSDILTEAVAKARKTIEEKNTRKRLCQQRDQPG